MIKKLKIKNYKRLEDIELDLSATASGKATQFIKYSGNSHRTQNVLSIAGIIGRNSVGKSTLLDAIEFMVDPTKLVDVLIPTKGIGSTLRHYLRGGDVSEMNLEEMVNYFLFNKIKKFYSMNATTQDESIIFEIENNNKPTIIKIDEDLSMNIGNKSFQLSKIASLNINSLFDKVVKEHGIDLLRSVNNINMHSDFEENKKDIKDMMYKLGELTIDTVEDDRKLKQSIAYLIAKEISSVINEFIKKETVNSVTKITTSRISTTYFIEEAIMKIYDKDKKALEHFSTIISYISPDVDQLISSKHGTSILVLLKSGKEVSIKSLSEGTVKTLSLLINIFSADQNTILIDEFENGLQERLIYLIIEIFNSSAKLSQKQLIFTTHSTYILDKMLDAQAGFVMSTNDENMTMINRKSKLARTELSIDKLYKSQGLKWKDENIHNMMISSGDLVELKYEADDIMELFDKYELKIGRRIRRETNSSGSFRKFN